MAIAATTTISVCNPGGSTADASTTFLFNGEAERTMMMCQQAIMDDFCLTALRSIDRVCRRPRTYRVEISEAQLREERLIVKNLQRLSRGDDLLENHPKQKSGIGLHDHHHAAAEEQEVHVQEIQETKRIRETKDMDDDYHYHRYKKPKTAQKRQPKPPQNKKKRVLRPAAQPQGPEPPPDISPELRDMITSMGGETPTLVIQKALTRTDISAQHHRVSMPFNSVRNEFLTPEEKYYYMTRTANNQIRTLEVAWIDPMMKVWKFHFKCWEMKKDEGNKRSSWSYVFGSPWLQMVQENGLEEDDVVQVWAFRVQSNLSFAMVLVAKGNGGQEDKVEIAESPY